MDDLFEILREKALPQSAQNQPTNGELVPRNILPQSASQYPLSPVDSGASTNAEALRRYLFCHYPLADARAKHPRADRSYKIDDRSENDSWVWLILARVPDISSPLLELTIQDVPSDANLEIVVAGLGGQVLNRDTHVTFQIPILPKYVSTIRKLAKALRQVDKLQPHGRWLPKRAAASLTALATHLSEFSS